MVKLFNTEKMMRSMILDAMQCMGGDGVPRAYPLERIMRDAKVLELAHKAREAAKSSSINPLGLHVVLGEDYPERQRNLQRSLQENRLVYVMVTAERT